MDTNVSLFQWPFRRLPLDETSKLLATLETLGVQQAWAGSFEAILHRDVGGVNQRLVAECNGAKQLRPVGAVNPTLPDWEEDVRRCHEEFKMPAIRVHPNYHGYPLEDPRFERLVALCAKRRLLIQLTAAMEDERTHHPLLHLNDVDLTPLPAICRRHPQARVQILNLRARGATLARLAEAPGILFDTSRMEDTHGVKRLLQHVPVKRVMYGSQAPFLIPQAAMIRLHESALPDEQMRALLRNNAEAF
ncbi:MAG: amidohydrolase family protein [Limisphaerales bacterium]